jgi:large subunit ribosomal protein L33
VTGEPNLFRTSGKNIGELLEQPQFPSSQRPAAKMAKKGTLQPILSGHNLSTPEPASTTHFETAKLILHLTAKSRTMAVRLISMAMTGYYRTMTRPRAHRPLSMLKYDPVVKKKVLFLEATKGGRAK